MFSASVIMSTAEGSTSGGGGLPPGAGLPPRGSTSGAWGCLPLGVYPLPATDIHFRLLQRSVHTPLECILVGINLALFFTFLSEISRDPDAGSTEGWGC